MPQLDIDLFDEFLFFAFISMVLGSGDEATEDNVIEMGADLFLVTYYIETTKKLAAQRAFIKSLLTTSIFHKN